MKVIDDALLDVMRELPSTWNVDRFDRMGMGWIARITNGKSVLELVSDRGYIGVERIVAGKPQSILPPEHLRMAISPKQVAELIVQHQD